MSEWCVSHTNGKTFWKISENDAASHICTFNVEMYPQKYNVVRSYHCAKPKEGILEMSRILADHYYAEADLKNRQFYCHNDTERI